MQVRVLSLAYDLPRQLARPWLEWTRLRISTPAFAGSTPAGRLTVLELLVHHRGSMRPHLFGPVLAQSGLQNFFGHGYWYHRIYRAVPGYTLDGVTFVSKTTTWKARQGNMPLRDNLEPRELLPRCIWSDPLRGLTLNAVGLSGPGAITLLARYGWQQRTDPFWISYMPVEETAVERLRAFSSFADLLCSERFCAPVGLQVNLSCPNQQAVSEEDVLDEACALVEQAAQLRQHRQVPVMLKLSVTTTPQQAKVLADHEGVDALCISNTVPFGALPERIDWNDLFGIPAWRNPLPEDSPLFARVGAAGGLSGPPLFPLVVDWVMQARACGINKHINAGGGVFSVDNVRKLKEAGADSVAIGTVAMHRPWRLRSILREAYRLFG